MAEYAIEPWGEFRSDLQAGHVAAMVGNALGGGKKHGGKFTPADFILIANKEPPKRRTWQEQMAGLKALTMAMGGIVKDKTGKVVWQGQGRR